jgi:hypothetical protein
MMRRRQLDAVGPGRVLGIAKLDDALLAGGPRARECTLILTEGDSVKTFAMGGLSVVGRERYGVFPLKGMPLNVRGATHKVLVDNAELRQVAAILGLSLRVGQKDIDPRTLRYGRLMIMADQVLPLSCYVDLTGGDGHRDPLTAGGLGGPLEVFAHPSGPRRILHQGTYHQYRAPHLAWPSSPPWVPDRVRDAHCQGKAKDYVCAMTDALFLRLSLPLSLALKRRPRRVVRPSPSTR